MQNIHFAQFLCKNVPKIQEILDWNAINETNLIIKNNIIVQLFVQFTTIYLRHLIKSM